MSDLAHIPWHARFEVRDIPPVTWLVLAVVTLGLDFLTGPYVQFPILYALPVGLAAWYSGLRWGLLLAVTMPWARFAFVTLWNEPEASHLLLINTLIRVSVLAALAILTHRAGRYARELDREVQILESMLPICAHCKRIRNEEQQWEGLEQYFHGRGGTRFSHGICPSCLQTYYPEHLDE